MNVGQLQFNLSWRLDLVSLLAGILLGILLARAARRFGPAVGRWRLATADHLRASLGWARSGIELRFQAAEAKYVQQFHLGHAWASLEQIFVPPRILPPLGVGSPIPPDQAAEQLSFYLWPELAGAMALPEPETISVRQMLLNGRRMAVAAPSGAGKTTLLAFCAHLCATAVSEEVDPHLAPIVPIFLPLVGLELGDPEEIEEDPFPSLITAIRQRGTSTVGFGLAGMIRRKAATGELLLLLDGWERLPPSRRTAVTDWLRHLLVSFPDLRIILTAPVVEYGPLLALEFHVVSLLPWRAGQVEQLLNRWSEALSLERSPRLKDVWYPGQSALHHSLRLWHVNVLPQTGTERGKRPHGLSELLTATMATLADKKVPHTIGGGQDHPDGEEPAIDAPLLSFWQRIGYTMVSEGKVTLSPVELKTIAEITANEQEQRIWRLAGRLGDTIEKNPLLVHWPNGHISFRVKVWRDYLAAGFLSQHGLVSEAATHVHEPEWLGVFRFLAAQENADEIAGRLLQERDSSLARDTLFQVAGWMPEARQEGRWRQQTLVQLGQIVRQPGYPRLLRQRAAAALAQSGDPGVFAFLKQLRDRSDPFLRELAVAALARLDSSKIVGMLSDMMGDEDANVRRTAVYALAWIHRPQAERPLITALVRGDDYMSRAAAEGLALNGRHGEEILREAVEEEELTVRRAAIRGLALLDAEWVLPLLHHIEYHDPEWLVQTAAAEAQEAIRGRSEPSPWERPADLLRSWLVSTAKRLKQPVPSEEDIVPFLVHTLSAADVLELRQAAALWLGQLAFLEGVPALEAAVRQAADREVREGALAALCLIHHAYPDP
ncbi:MAG: NACHT domain-containing protein [Anaerolineae bacterium]